jgi:branched-chain amino acid transport system ATP-binding protein
VRVDHPTRPKIVLPEGAPLLALDELVVDYGGIRAVKGVSLEVRSGEVVALVGANGAGKTTTLKTIAGLVRPAAGAIHFAGRALAGVSVEERVERGISLSPEGRAIFPNLTVRENLELGAYAHKDRAAMAETLADVVTLFARLGERLSQTAGTLSGGEQQMLAIGRALMARPALLLLDEPSLGIAPKLVQQIFEAIGRIARAGVTILLVEQNTRLALATSQRAYVLRAGEVVLSGEARRLADDPEIQAAYLGG